MSPCVALHEGKRIGPQDGVLCLEENSSYEIVARESDCTRAWLDQLPLATPSPGRFSLTTGFWVGKSVLHLETPTSRTAVPIRVRPARHKMDHKAWQCMLGDLETWLSGLSFQDTLPAPVPPVGPSHQNAAPISPLPGNNRHTVIPSGQASTPNTAYAAWGGSIWEWHSPRCIFIMMPLLGKSLVVRPDTHFFLPQRPPTIAESGFQHNSGTQPTGEYGHFRPWKRDVGILWNKDENLNNYIKGVVNFPLRKDSYDLYKTRESTISLLWIPWFSVL